MTRRLAELLSQYVGKDLILDTNLLLVLTIGRSNQRLIQQHKRTREVYQPEDSSLIADLFAHFDRRLTTPHILSEVSNLLGQSSELLKSQCFESFAEMVGLLEEIHVPGQQLSAHPLLSDFGLTDLGIQALAATGACLVVSADSRLVAYLAQGRIDTLDFQWIRVLNRG